MKLDIQENKCVIELKILTNFSLKLVYLINFPEYKQFIVQIIKNKTGVPSSAILSCYLILSSSPKDLFFNWYIYFFVTAQLNLK